MMEAELRIVYKTCQEAKAVSEAVSPDNLDASGELVVETVNHDKCVETKITYDGNNLLTFRSTIDDLLSCISVAEKSLLATSDTVDSSN